MYSGRIEVDERISDNSDKLNAALGYIRGEKFNTSLWASGLPVWVRYSDFKEADPLEQDPPVRITSSVLYDYYKSNIHGKLMSGFTSIKFDPLDMKTLVMVACVAIGGVLGFLLLFG